MRAKVDQKQVPVRKGRDLAAREIERHWGDLPVVDATRELRVFIAPEDVRGATPKEPAGCVFARACQRQFKARKVLFYRRVAYVELPDERGNRRVERFEMTAGMRELVAAFDRGEGVIPDGGFVLRPPKPSERFDAKWKWNRRQAEKERAARAQLIGEAIPKARASRDAPLVIDLAVRSGRGAVHFARKADRERGVVGEGLEERRPS